MKQMRHIKQAAKSLGRNFEINRMLPGTTYHENSTVVIIPTRGMVHHRVIQSWNGLITPMNQKRAVLFAVGDEVGVAYNNMIKNILDHPELSKWKYVLTLEDDNIVPADAHVRLLESIEWGKFDAVSGIYFTKGDFGMPMAYGDPAEYEKTGQLDFKPRDIRAALEAGNVMEVNGIGMGAALWRLELFRQIPPPWFVTVNDMTPAGAMVMTQDLNCCRAARLAGKRFAVDLRVKVGHLDINSGVVY